MRNLPHQPFRKSPLLWGAPPTGDDAEDIASSVIAPPPIPAGGGSGNGGIVSLSGMVSAFTFAYNNLAGSINTAFPLAIRVAAFGFTTAVGLISVVLSSSIKNATTDGVCGLFIAKDIGATLNLSQQTDVYVDHIVTAGLSHSMRSGTVFADDVALKLGSNEKVALYASSAGTGFAGSLLTGIVTVRYFSLT